MILKYAGSKSKIMDQIIPHFPDDAQVFVDPFCGSLASSMAIAKHGFDGEYIVADANPHVMATYRWATILPRQLRVYVEALLKVVIENHLFLELRKEFNKHRNDMDMVNTARFIGLNRTCFNGLIRYNSSGEFNTPWGKYTAPTIPENAIDMVHRFLIDHNVQMGINHFAHTMVMTAAQARSGRKKTIIYCDPPYWGTGVPYVPKLLWKGEEEHDALDLLARSLVNAGSVEVFISGASETPYERHTDSVKIDSSTTISADATGRGKTEERLFIYRKEQP